MTATRVLITGANGLVGNAVLLNLLSSDLFEPVAAVRDITKIHNLCSVEYFNLDSPYSVPSLDGVDVVIHTAAKVHVLSDFSGNAFEEFRRVNVKGTISLAESAVKAHVKRFIFISSIKVNGESTRRGHPFKAEHRPNPLGAYALSKYEAELALVELGKASGMEIVIIRPPLVYGPGVKANFLTMLNWLRRGIPLPFGAIKNRRSLVSVGNLVSLILTCISHPSAANQIFLVSDGVDLTTTDLLRSVSKAMGKPSHLIPVPVFLLKLLLCMVGKRRLAQRLFDSLQVNIDKNKQLLGWVPSEDVNLSLQSTAENHIKRIRK
ncbi:NAD-dependent epimerase/dehydratase family protein [Pseudomonas sp.]|uniref:NAD-dependent epimerase/dehydratase family protein n=1 Tax=Pseudomonas sp. TaxID=306 RepID=UPI00257D7CD0|nr:NAD-dependent epimerase/dehydratase family protein [Pseudomonas sp.]